MAEVKIYQCNVCSREVERKERQANVELCLDKLLHLDEGKGVDVCNPCIARFMASLQGTLLNIRSSKPVSIERKKTPDAVGDIAKVVDMARFPKSKPIHHWLFQAVVLPEIDPLKEKTTPGNKFRTKGLKLSMCALLDVGVYFEEPMIKALHKKYDEFKEITIKNYFTTLRSPTRAIDVTDVSDNHKGRVAEYNEEGHLVWSETIEGTSTRESTPRGKGRDREAKNKMVGKYFGPYYVTGKSLAKTASGGRKWNCVCTVCGAKVKRATSTLFDKDVSHKCMHKFIKSYLMNNPNASIGDARLYIFAEGEKGPKMMKEANKRRKNAEEAKK